MYFIRGAFYLSLVGVCAISFASAEWQPAAPLSVKKPGTSIVRPVPTPRSRPTPHPRPTPPSNIAGGTWTFTGSLNTGRFTHTATLLPSGLVLVAGGSASANVTRTAELYDPASGSWRSTGSLNTERYGHTATLLANGTVHAAGGDFGSGSLPRPERQ